MTRTNNETNGGVVSCVIIFPKKSHRIVKEFLDQVKLGI